MNDDARNRLSTPPRHDELTQLQETRHFENARDTVRESGFDPYSAPELEAASSMSGASTMQRVVALILLLGLLVTFGIALFG